MIHRVVLDVQLAETQAIGQARAPHQRRKARIEARAGLARDRQDLAVPPEVLRPPLDLLAGHPDGRIVVDRLQGAQTFLADPQGLGGKSGFTQMTLQSDERAHTASEHRAFQSEI
jgi:hypothetical protein